MHCLEVLRFALYLHDFGSQIGLRLVIARPHSFTALIIQNGDILLGLPCNSCTSKPANSIATSFSRSSSACVEACPAQTTSSTVHKKGARCAGKSSTWLRYAEDCNTKDNKVR